MNLWPSVLHQCSIGTILDLDHRNDLCCFLQNIFRDVIIRNTIWELWLVMDYDIIRYRLSADHSHHLYHQADRNFSNKTLSLCISRKQDERLRRGNAPAWQIIWLWLWEASRGAVFSFHHTKESDRPSQEFEPSIFCNTHRYSIPMTVLPGTSAHTQCRRCNW